MAVDTTGFVDTAQREADSRWADFWRSGPGTLAGRYLRTFWQPVFRAVDLPAGRAKPITIMSEQFTLYRGQGGVPHLLAFRCAHRGTQLSTGWVEGDCVRCFCHGWKYDATGQCVEQPAEDAGFAPKIRIASYPTQEYLGLIFAYLGAGEPPALPRYREFEADGLLRQGMPITWPCNYANRTENSHDPVHIAFVHRGSNSHVGVPDVAAEETEYGMRTSENWGLAPGTAAREEYNFQQFHWPNINCYVSSPTEPDWIEHRHLSWRVPVDDQHVVSFTMDFLPLTGQAAEDYLARGAQRAARERQRDAAVRELGERILRGELHIDEVQDRAFIFNVQDYVAQVGQGPIAPREHDRLGRSDAAVILFRRIWERELRALAEGRPRKQWRRPETLPGGTN